VDEWAEIVRPHFSQGNVNFIAGAAKLIEAKKALKKHGKFIELVEVKLRMDISTVERWMRIARNQVLANSAHAPNLPLSWMTLYTLSQLPSNVLERFIEDGTVNPDLGRKEAERLVKKVRGSNAAGAATAIERLQVGAVALDAARVAEPQADTAKPDSPIVVSDVGQDDVGLASRGEIERKLARLEELEHETRRQEIQLARYESEVVELKGKLSPETNIDPQRRIFQRAVRSLQKAETAGTLEKERRFLTQHATADFVEIVRSAVRDGLRVDQIDLVYRPEVH
jgi:hypothetical protein